MICGALTGNSTRNHPRKQHACIRRLKHGQQHVHICQCGHTWE